MVHDQSQRGRLHLGTEWVLEAQCARTEFEPRRRGTSKQAPLQVRQLQRRQVRGELSDHVRQGQIGRNPAQLAVGQRGPDAQSTVTAFHIHRVIEPGSPRAEIRTADLGKYPPVPGAWLRDGVPDQFSPNLDRGAEPSGRTRRESGGMLVPVVLEPEIERVEYQRRGAAQVIGPFDLGVAQHDLSLAQHPVGHPTVSRFPGFEHDSANRDAPACIAPD